MTEPEGVQRISDGREQDLILPPPGEARWYWLLVATRTHPYQPIQNLGSGTFVGKHEVSDLNGRSRGWFENPGREPYDALVLLTREELLEHLTELGLLHLLREEDRP